MEAKTERELFETQILSMYPAFKDFSRDGRGRYQSLQVEFGWQLWGQARAQIASAPSVSVDEAITLLETFADSGMIAFYDNGSPTPNRKHCLAAAQRLRAEAGKAQPVAHAVDAITLAKTAYDGGAPALSLVAQLLGNAPCETCGYHHAHCRCTGPAKSSDHAQRIVDHDMLGNPITAATVAERSQVCQWRVSSSGGVYGSACEWTTSSLPTGLLCPHCGRRIVRPAP